MLVERLGPRPLRLRTELERLALWAGRRRQRRRRRPRRDDRRHLRGGDLVARRRDRSRGTRPRPCASPSSSSPRARRCRGSSTRSRRGCARRCRPRASSRRARRRRRSRAASRCIPTRRRCSSPRVKGRSPAELDALDPRDRRPRALVARRLGLRGGRRADDGPAAGPSATRTTSRASPGRYELAPARMRAARDFLRAPVLRCIAPFWTALSIRETSALCSARRPSCRRPRRRPLSSRGSGS